MCHSFCLTSGTLFSGMISNFRKITTTLYEIDNFSTVKKIHYIQIIHTYFEIKEHIGLFSSCSVSTKACVSHWSRSAFSTASSLASTTICAACWPRGAITGTSRNCLLWTPWPQGPWEGVFRPSRPPPSNSLRSSFRLKQVSYSLGLFYIFLVVY